VGVTVSLYHRLEAGHSTATELGRQGVPLDVIQKCAAHESTEAYAKLARPGAGRGDPTPDGRRALPR